MIEFLGHKFTKRNYNALDNAVSGALYYECIICNIIIYKSNPFHHYYISKLWSKSTNKNKMLDLTCNDVIIKNIIE